MRILVIDDERKNIASAYLTLRGNEVTTCDTIQSAYDTLQGDQEFDAVLTDLFFPLGSFHGAMDTVSYDLPSGNLPAGLVFAIKAANKGIRTVICTDANHHSDWICSLLDLVGDFGSVPKRTKEKIAYVEARHASIRGYWDEIRKEIVMCDPPGWRDPNNPKIKNWKKAMVRSGLFPEL